MHHCRISFEPAEIKVNAVRILVASEHHYFPKAFTESQPSSPPSIPQITLNSTVCPEPSLPLPSSRVTYTEFLSSNQKTEFHISAFPVLRMEEIPAKALEHS